MINYLEELLNTIQDTFSLPNISIPDDLFVQTQDVIQYQYNDSFYYVDKPKQIMQTTHTHTHTDGLNPLWAINLTSTRSSPFMSNSVNK